MTEDELKRVWEDFWKRHKNVDVFSRFYSGAHALYKMLLEAVVKKNAKP